MTGSLRLFVLFCGVVLAPVTFADGDAEAGRTKSETCRGCHAIGNYKNVYPTYKVPKLAGQNKDYLVLALKAYKSGERSHPTMQSQAASMSEQDMEDIAVFLAGQSGEGE